MAPRFAKVALALPLHEEFTYALPERLRDQVVPGCRVRVPFGSRRTTAVVTELCDDPGDIPAAKLKAIDSRLGDTPALPREMLDFTRELAAEYCCPWGIALDAAWPAGLKHKPSNKILGVEFAKPEHEVEAEAFDLEDSAPKRARVLRNLKELGSPAPLRLVLERSGVSKSPVSTLVKHGWLRWTQLEPEGELIEQSRLERAPRHDLSDAQRTVVDKIRAAVDARQHETFLLHGVTGSGKTEVYLRALETVRAQDRSAIILVPEISLTPQTVGRFLSRFPDVAVLHSSLTEAERARQWLRLARGQAKIVVGARSALFAPLRKLGLIVVDEEHEASFKQQQSPRYHARDMAELRGRQSGAAVVLGSATPSLESWHRAKLGEITLLELPGRVAGSRMPKVAVVDMRAEKPIKGRPPVFSKALELQIQERVRAQDQVLLFLNRRGFAPVLYCSACGETVSCQHCDAPMTWHSDRHRLICHHCMEDRRRPELCPTCEATTPVQLGSGTERVEEIVRKRFADLIVARMDSDTMTRKDSYERVLSAFRRGDIDVLVGTQMIAKGLDFPNLTLVGVVAADTGLFMPDFRASERTFQVLTQVAGRAGRGEREGLVVVQTLSPDAEPIRFAARFDFEGFASAELESRRRLGYPPFGRIVRIVVESADLRLAEGRASEIASELRALTATNSSLQTLGPGPAPLGRIRGRYRRHVLVKCPRAALPSELVRRLRKLDGGDRKLRVLVDVDPQSLL